MSFRHSVVHRLNIKTDNERKKHKKCRPVPGKNSRDAEISGCSKLIEKLMEWVDKCVCVRLLNVYGVLSSLSLSLCTLHLSLDALHAS